MRRFTAAQPSCNQMQKPLQHRENRGSGRNESQNLSPRHGDTETTGKQIDFIAGKYYAPKIGPRHGRRGPDTAIPYYTIKKEPRFQRAAACYCKVEHRRRRLVQEAGQPATRDHAVAFPGLPGTSCPSFPRLPESRSAASPPPKREAVLKNPAGRVYVTIPIDVNIYMLPKARHPKCDSVPVLDGTERQPAAADSRNLYR